LLKALASGGSSTQIQVDGDETVLLEISALIKDFYPDLVTPLSIVLGDKRASKVAATLEMGLSVFANFASNLGEDIAQTAGAKVADRFTTTEAFADHLNELDALRLRVDRLSARISQRERNERGNDNQ
jgi:ubiquinone biosynthesis protein UbiJ